MKVPFSWLKEYVDIDVTAQELEDKLFGCGFEVEELIDLSAEIDRVVVGVVKECTPVEGTHLYTCKVDCGEYGNDIQIVTGAPNVYAGMHTPAALDNSTLPGGIKIKAKPMRGIESNGMLCSGEELGLNEDLYPGSEVYGLLDLPKDTVPGTDIAKVVGLDDYIFDISVTANRADCQSVLGIAREVAAVLDKPLKMPALDYKESDYKYENLDIKVEAQDLCPRYIAHYVYDVKLGQSPAWMRRRLALVGNNSISNIVDITNYIMRELGQPLHAFDCDYLEGNAIQVRRANEGEKIITLDEKEFTLNPSNLVICDGKKPVALAGIMGGLNSEIRDTTTEVMFESAKFARDNIRRSSRALGQSSDASQRYSKGVDEYATEMAMKRVLHLVEELGAGKISKTHKNVNTGNSLEPVTFTTSIKKVNGVLGITVPDEDILRILTGLNFQPEINGDELTMHFPAYREDMEDYPDVAEEVIRMYGYDHITSTFMPSAKVTIGGSNLRQRTILKVKRTLCSVGAFEGIHYSFFSPSDLDEMGFAEDAPERRAIRIMNPINEDLSLMRTTLAPQMIHAMGRNQKRGIFEGRIFEIGNAFIPKSLPLTEYPEERETLCIGAFGKEESFFTLKGMAEAVANVLNITFNYEKAEKPFLHPYQTAAIFCEGEEIGYLGKVKYEIMKDEAMREDAYVLEISMKALEKWYGKAKVFEPLPKFPEEKRDLALVMDKDITCGQVEGCIREACAYVKDVSLFDVYEGRQIAADKKSMAFTVLFTPKEEAFKADTVDGYVKKVLKQLNKTYGIELRS